MRLLPLASHPDIASATIIPGKRALMPATIMAQAHFARAAFYAVTDTRNPDKRLATVAVAGNDDDREHFPDFADRYVFNAEAGLKIVRGPHFPVLIADQRRSFGIRVGGPAGMQRRETHSPHDLTALKLGIQIDPEKCQAPVEFDLAKLTGPAREEAFDNLVNLLRGGQIFTDPVSTGPFGHLWTVDVGAASSDGVYVLINPLGANPEFKIEHAAVLRGTIGADRRLLWQVIPTEAAPDGTSLTVSHRTLGSNRSTLAIDFDALGNGSLQPLRIHMDEHGNVTSGLQADAQTIKHLGEALYWGLEKYFR